GDVRVGRRVQRIRLSLRNAVANQLAIQHLQRIAGQTDDPLHEILCPVNRPLKDDDVAALRSPDSGELHSRERNFGAINELVHEEKIADKQRTFHATGWNLERLDEERADDEKQSES